MKLGVLVRRIASSLWAIPMVYLGKDPVTYNVAGSFLRLRSSHNLMLIDGSDALDGPGKRRQDDHGHTHQNKTVRHAD